jgi:hypothetical protein
VTVRVKPAVALLLAGSDKPDRSGEWEPEEEIQSSDISWDLKHRANDAGDGS